jgi:3-isopropylmalate/(R)-2-methylmalate dehydratase small subunit
VAGLAATVSDEHVARHSTATTESDHGVGAALFDLFEWISSGEKPQLPPNRRPVSILIVRAAVEIGSVAENAESLAAAGIRAIVANGFGPVIFSRAVRQGVVLVPLDVDDISRLANWVERHRDIELVIDLETQVVKPGDDEPIRFEMHPWMQQRLLLGRDDLDDLLQHRDQIASFRAADRARRPWLYCDEASSKSNDEQ